jgi:putative hemin transport protein
MATKEELRAFVRDNPGQMTLLLAKKFNVPEAEIIRAFPDDRAVELDPARWEEVIRSLEAFGEVHVIVSNGATTLEAVGQFGGFSTAGVFFNVQTESLDMHIRWQELGSIFAVEKPSHLEGQNTFSFQFFDRSGHAAFKVFLNFGGKIEPTRAEVFGRMREEFRKNGSTP